jgi:enoyl-CoA hydratase
MTNPSYVSLSIARSDAIAEVTLLGPGKGNRMGPEFWREMSPAFASLDADPSVRAIVLKGSGAHFSSGLDLMAMAGELGPALANGGLAADRLALLALIERMQDAISAVERCRKPVIAAITGWCIGGAVDLITACDVRLCARDAKFSVREVKLAIVADVGTLQRLPFIVGQGVARELALTGDDIDAARALKIGLVNDVYEDADQLLAAARSMAQRIAANSPLAVQGTKQILNGGLTRLTRENMREVALWNSAFLASTDLQEAIMAFAEKRTATFTGK